MERIHTRRSTIYAILLSLALLLFSACATSGTEITEDLVAASDGLRFGHGHAPGTRPSVARFVVREVGVGRPPSGRRLQAVITRDFLWYPVSVAAALCTR